MVVLAPATLRRAVDFVETRRGLEIDIEAIARDVGVSPRAIQLSFRRHLDCTPTAYVRGVRLRGAHDQLRDARRGDGLTVSRVALDWGFNNPSRFAAYYRRTYGRSPGETLRG
jgi:transcriptional regulator GlxA family with amidase domain